MKKILLFAAATMCALSMNAGFGIKINGTDYHAGTKNDSPLDPSFQEFMVLGISVSNGSTLQLWDDENNAGWAVDLDPASVAGISRDGDHYNCTADGCYDFYIKIKNNADQLYIGACQGGGDNNGGDNNGGDNNGGGDQNASYGIMVNGTDYHAGTLNPSPLDPSFQEYQVLGVSVSSGATLQLWDDNAKQGWAVDLDQASVAGISRDGDHYNCTADGCYDFYIKLKMNEDQLYIGACQGGGDNGGGDNGGGNGGGETSDHYYYYKGFVDGNDIESYMEGVNNFTKGVASFSCSQKSYLFVVYQVHGIPGIEYACKEYIEESAAHQATLYKSPSPFEKMGFEPGSYTLYLYKGDTDETLILSTVELPGKTLVDSEENGGNNGDGDGDGEKPDDDAIDNIFFLDVNAPMYDVLGRQVTDEYHGIVIQNGHKFIR